jgi:hypothetical protein
MWPTPARAPRTAVLVFLVVGTFATTARGQTASSTRPSPEDVAAAAALFKDAKELAQAQNLGPACDKFAESQRLDPHLGTLIYLATCHELLGKTASAWGEFTRAADLAARTHESAREQLARNRAAALESRLSKIVVQVRVRTPDMHIEINGREKDPATLADPLPVDPGEYTIRASAQGHQDWVKTIAVAAGPTTLVVDVPPLTELPTGGSTAAPVVSPVTPVVDARQNERVTEQPPGESMPSRGWRTAGFVIGGVGLAGIGVGTYFGLTAFALKHRADTYECTADRACSQQGLTDHKNENTDATISTISFGVGLAALAVGTYLVLRPPSVRKAAARRWIAPQVGAGAVGIAGGAVW